MTEIKTRPMPNRVLIRPTEVDSKTASGLYIPDIAKPKPSEGIVVATGLAMEFVAIGDLAFYNNGAGVEIEENGVKYLCLKEIPDIYAVR
jgi:chaperonin GroES